MTAPGGADSATGYFATLLTAIMVNAALMIGRLFYYFVAVPGAGNFGYVTALVAEVWIMLRTFAVISPEATFSWSSPLGMSGDHAHAVMPVFGLAVALIATTSWWRSRRQGVSVATGPTATPARPPGSRGLAYAGVALTVLAAVYWLFPSAREAQEAGGPYGIDVPDELIPRDAWTWTVAVTGPALHVAGMVAGRFGFYWLAGRRLRAAVSIPLVLIAEFLAPVGIFLASGWSLSFESLRTILSNSGSFTWLSNESAIELGYVTGALGVALLAVALCADRLFDRRSRRSGDSSLRDDVPVAPPALPHDAPH
ncbi:hypothetical protein GCM10010401_11790 [Rarobacter faecitabidus]|nr:hypothetical protein [Rarobacter faecitabidus]